MLRKVAVALSIIVCLVLISGGCGGAQVGIDPEEFYKTNAITICMNGPAGGTSDFAARIFAEYWPQVTGGPTPEVKVMAGGGGLEGINYIYYNAKPDGLSIGVDHHSSDFTGPLVLGVGGVDFDARELEWIGAFGYLPIVFYVGADSSYKTVDDLKNAGKTLHFGTTTAGSLGHMALAFAIEALKLDATITVGYEATEIGLALKRGELDGTILAANVAIGDVDKGFARVLWVSSLKRSAWFPDAPAIAELVQLTAAQEDMLGTLDTLVGCKSFYMPPNTPADKVDYVRYVFDKMAAMPSFIEAAKPKYPVWDTPATGEELLAELETLTAMPQEDKQAIQDLLKKYTK